MKKNWRGFTLIEVSLFLAITGLVFVGIAVGTQNSIFQQRYNDSVQNFAEFLRGVYSQTTNIQSEGSGNSEMAIYGKLVTFGETVDLAGNDVGDKNSVFSYNVIGAVDDNIQTGSVIDALKKLKVNVARLDESGRYTFVGIAEDYMPRWGAQIQTTRAYSGGYEKYKGALLVVRHPRSGTVYTYVMSGETIEVNKTIKENNASRIDGLLVNNLDKFGIGEANYCINPNGNDYYNLRRDVRIVKNARNASGIELMPTDEGNPCL